MKAKFLIVLIFFTFLTCSCIAFWAHKIDTEESARQHNEYTISNTIADSTKKSNESPTIKVIQIYIDGLWYCIPIIENQK